MEPEGGGGREGILPSGKHRSVEGQRVDLSSRGDRGEKGNEGRRDKRLAYSCPEVWKGKDVEGEKEGRIVGSVARSDRLARCRPIGLSHRLRYRDSRDNEAKHLG